MDDEVNKIREFFYSYSLKDVATALFIMGVYPKNLASPVKMSLLWETLRHSDPSKYNSTDKIKTYSQYRAFADKLIQLCPPYTTVEDFLSHIDWGDIKYKFRGTAYKVFYHGDLENPYDYLMVFDKFIAEASDEIEKATGRNPGEELETILKLQDSIIAGIPYKKTKSKQLDPGNFEVPDKIFWRNAQKFYEDYVEHQAPNLEASFLATYSKPIKHSSKFNPQSIPDLFMKGKATPYIFLTHKGKYYLANSRLINSIFFASMDDAVKKAKVQISRPILNRAIFRFLNERYKEVYGPLVIDASRHEDSLEYAAAFICGEKLTLIYVTEPIHNTQTDLDGIFQKASADIDSLNQNSCKIFDLATMNIIEWRSAEGKKLTASVIVVPPLLPTAFGAYSFQKRDNITAIFADEFFSIFDNLESLNEFSDFQAYKNRMSHIVMPMAREIDKFASYRQSQGTLVTGASDPNVIWLAGSMGGDYRFDKLKLFWSKFPRIDWGGNDPTSWDIEDRINDVRIYQKKNRFNNAFYVQLGKVDFFALAPYNLFRNDKDLVKAVDLVCQIGTDYFSQYVGKAHIKEIVPFSKLKIVCYPQDLLKDDKFQHWRNLDPGNKPWCIDVVQTGEDELAIRVVINKEQYFKLFEDSTDNSPEINIMLDALTKLEPYNAPVIQPLIKKLEQRRGKPRRFSIDKLDRRVNFPEFVPANQPQNSDYKLIDTEIAKKALAKDIKPGLYQGERAIDILGKLRDMIREVIDEDVSKYDLSTSLPLLLESIDALTNEREIKYEGLKLSATRDVDFDIQEEERENYSQFVHFGNCYRYLMEKFVQLSPSSETALHPREFIRLITLVDRLREVYQASSTIRFSLVRFAPKLRVHNNYLVEIVEDKRTEQNNKLLEKEDTALRLKPGVKKIELLDTNKEIENINQAFLADFGFEFKNMLAFLALLAQWSDKSSAPEATNYSASEKELISVAQKAFQVDITAEELKKIIDFLTLKPDEILKITGSSDDAIDIPIWEHKKRPMRYTLRPLIKDGELFRWGPYSAYKSIGVWHGPLLSGMEPYTFDKKPTIAKVLAKIKQVKEKEIVHQAFEQAKAVSAESEKDVFLHKRDGSAGHPETLGDYDVLSFLRDKGILLNIECKFVVTAHTHKDAFTQSEYYFDDTKKQRYVKRVEERQTYLEKNTEKVFQTMGWNFPKGKVKVVSIIVVNNLYAWLRFPLRDTPVLFMDLERLEEFIAKLKT